MMAPAEGDPSRRHVRIVIADDHQVVRRGLELVLESEADFDVVAVAGDVTSALAHVREFAPDVLVLDLNMPGGSVLRTIPTLRAEAPATQVVVLTMEADTGSVRAARRNGALGYVLKEAAESELADAERRPAAGETYLTRRMASQMYTEEVLREPWD
jgi:two-component system response regulator NreC